MSDRVLTSLANPQVKQLVKLLHKRARTHTGLTRVDGARELVRALEGGLVPATVFVCPARLTSAPARQALAAALRAGARQQLVSEAVYAKIQYGDRDEGLCATVPWRARALEDLKASEAPFFLVLEGLEKPGNLGAILRTAEAAGVDAVLLVDAALDPSNPNAVRASQGALFTMPLICTTTALALAYLRQRHIGIVAAVVQATQAYTAVDLRGPLAVMLGPERDAPSPLWREAARHQVRIPLHGTADSLNVSVAAAILLFEAVRQRSKR